MFAAEHVDQHLDERQPDRLGEAWIGAIQDGALDRLEGLCTRGIAGRLLLPAGLVTVHNIADLLAEYRNWFGSCSDFRLEASRVDFVGPRLGIFYRFLLKDQGDWYQIEQQLYCWLKNGRVQQLHLVCSGFHAVRGNEAPPQANGTAAESDEPRRDGLLEYMSDAAGTAATCAILTPLIRSRLDELQSGQVLEVRVNDAAAKGDVESWSRLSGNALLKVVDDDPQLLRFFVKKK